MKWITLILVLARALTACQTVEGDQITGKDFSAASASFAALDPALEMGFAPRPGVRRVFSAAEVARIAQSNKIELSAPAEDMCFELATEPLTENNLLPVLRLALVAAGLNGDEVKLELLDFSRSGVPHGALEFTRSALSASGIWRGRVSYGTNRSAPVWVKVRLTTVQTWLEAAEPLQLGKPIEAANLIVRTGDRYPFAPPPLVSIDQAAGRMPLRSVQKGEPLFAAMLIQPHEVERGETVAVDVISGDARLSFDGTAESSGRIGESILIRNPDNGKNFKARVAGKGKVSLVL